MALTPHRLLGGALVALILVGSLGAAAWRFVPDRLAPSSDAPRGPAAPHALRAAFGDLASLDPQADETMRGKTMRGQTMRGETARGETAAAPRTRSIAPRPEPAAAFGGLGGSPAAPAPADFVALRRSVETQDVGQGVGQGVGQDAPAPVPTPPQKPVVLALAPVPPADAPADGFSPPPVVPLPPSAPFRPDLSAPTPPLPPVRPPGLRAALPPGPPPKPEAPVARPGQPAPDRPDPATQDRPSFLSFAPPLAPPVERPLDRPVEPQAPSGPFARGQAAYVRIFKQEGQLELWLKRGGRFALYKSFPICKWSGKLGPKVKEGDYQSPEGFYTVTARQLNPNSQYHLAFNVGFPNAYDRQHGRTGSALMVHGDCASVGCYAMTNKGIEEIYGYLEAALKNGQREVPVHIFPFRMSSSAIARNAGGGGLASLLGGGGASANWGDFWRNLKEGYDLFERTGEPPAAYACNKRYAFGAAGAGCARIAGW